MSWKLGSLIVGAIGVLVLAIWASGVSPAEALGTLFRGTLGSPSAISGTLRETTPLLFTGLAVFLALRAGLFNIGVEGQFLIGAMIGSAFAIRFPGPFGITFALIGGAFGGAVWAAGPGWIKAYRHGHEVITTIMLNSVALYLTSYVVSGVIKDPAQQSAPTVNLAEASRLPWLVNAPPVQVSWALPLALVSTLGLAWWLKKTISGYELQAVGANPIAASYAGIDAPRMIFFAMLGSGAIAGFAGAIQVVAFEGRFYSGFSPGYGFDALGVALLAGNQAQAVIPAALLFGVLAKGGTALQIFGIPKGITTVFLGLIILIAAAIRYRKVIGGA